jgi:hypothetical protein
MRLRTPRLRQLCKHKPQQQPWCSARCNLGSHTGVICMKWASNVQTFAYYRWSTAAARTPINPSGRQEGDKCWAPVPIIGQRRGHRSRPSHWLMREPLRIVCMAPPSVREHQVHSAVEIGMAANLSQLMRPIQLNECECCRGWEQANEWMNE